MILSIIDWLIIGVYIIFTIAIGLYYRRKAGNSLSDYFLGGRKLPWYIAGISMVATTFAADTPLAVTELVGKNGIAGNWLWWNFLIGGMLTTFFFARLWRRAEVLTELELINIRYSGKQATFLRGFKAVYLGLLMNSIIIAWVNLALMTLIEVFFGIHGTNLLWIMAAAMAVAMIYSTISGLWGVAITDVVQFVIAMSGSIILAIIVISSEEIGGIAGLKSQVPEQALSFFPKIGGDNIAGTLTISAGAFLAFGVFQWWASWYPGAEPGGGGYIAQRMMSTKNEKHSIFATLFFQTAHYAIRPWPWILVGLAAIVLYPDLPETELRLGYVMAMKDFLPVGLKGLLLVAFLSAYMSTISTQLNFGASILTNDLFLLGKTKEQKENKKNVTIGRLFTIAIMIISLIITSQIESISGVWAFVIECGAGLGMVLILRWYWWRINAWSEITATIVPFLVYGTIQLIKFFMLQQVKLKHGVEVFVEETGKMEIIIPPEIMETFTNTHANLYFPGSFFWTITITTIAWIAITFLTKPTKENVLLSFYKKVKPQGAWKPIQKLSGLKSEKDKYYLLNLTVCWLSSIVLVYSILFFIGKLIFGEWQAVGIYGVIILVSLFIFRWFVNKTKIFD